MTIPCIWYTTLKFCQSSKHNFGGAFTETKTVERDIVARPEPNTAQHSPAGKIRAVKSVQLKSKQVIGKILFDGNWTVGYGWSAASEVLSIRNFSSMNIFSNILKNTL